MALETVYWKAQSDVGRQRVVDCWSSNRERASSELGTDARDGQQRSAGRTHRSGRCRFSCITESRKMLLLPNWNTTNPYSVAGDTAGVATVSMSWRYGGVGVVSTLWVSTAVLYVMRCFTDCVTLYVFCVVLDRWRSIHLTDEVQTWRTS